LKQAWAAGNRYAGNSLLCDPVRKDGILLVGSPQCLTHHTGVLRVGHKAKIIETTEGVIDLTTYSWDDERFSSALKLQHPMDDDKAHAISRFVREALEELKVYRITPPIVEAVVRATLEEHGLPNMVHVPLDKSLFTRNGLTLSNNAKTVLERRYPGISPRRN
jgi:hypothetical protein